LIDVFSDFCVYGIFWGYFDTANIKQREKAAETEMQEGGGASLPTETLLSVRKSLVLRF
jgi:hypothetical protein